MRMPYAITLYESVSIHLKTQLPAAVIVNAASHQGSCLRGPALASTCGFEYFCVDETVSVGFHAAYGAGA
jgi:hypothetical protein